MDLKTFCRAFWDRILAIAVGIAGVIALFVGWYGVSGTALDYKQVPYIISGGLVGLFLLGLGATLWISGDLHDEWRKLDHLERTVSELRASVQLAADGKESAQNGAQPQPAKAVGRRRGRATAETPTT
jgi:hypothetical protein